MRMTIRGESERIATREKLVCGLFDQKAHYGTEDYAQWRSG